jgi:hypothetical protein
METDMTTNETISGLTITDTAAELETYRRLRRNIRRALRRGANMADNWCEHDADMLMEFGITRTHAVALREMMDNWTWDGAR